MTILPTAIASATMVVLASSRPTLTPPIWLMPPPSASA